MNTHNFRQKRARLAREITHFEAQCERFTNPVTAQEKRARTLATRCLYERQRDLARLLATSTEST